ncbi:tRNA-dihydrouridine synthase family protein [uncultured Bacteroides sp.]|uniref:tRNA-dihydrouridine synthase family protein n=1 Tax=uncultured Bacteroides sp. TaxID=162156 RepID=UPI002675F54E|nr:tRNA-dihydrouridine synthase family protein [uncultured Bacteroides sp.]
MQEILPIHFAPLQGYTEVVYRNAHAACFGGADVYYTPFVRLEKEGFRRKDIRGLEPAENRVPRLIPQLIAPTPEKAEAVLSLFIEKGYTEADINLGCPFPMLAKRHNGSGLLPYPEEVKALLELTLKYPRISFSVKMRLGWERPDECLALAPVINDFPLRHITMHPRLGKQQYKGKADLEGFAAFLHLCRHPLIYNGDIDSPEDIRRIQKLFPAVAGVMIGRGLLANPALATEYKENRSLTPDEIKEKLYAMHASVYERYAAQLEGGDAQLLNKMKVFWEYLMPDAGKKPLKAIHKSTSLDKYNRAIHAFFDEL